MRLYLAGPDVFRPDAPARAARKKALCARHGHRGLDPTDHPLPVADSPAAVAMAIYRANQALMAQADGIVADLSPFRGPSADPGTVFELGFMLGRGKPAWAFSTCRRSFEERTRALAGSGGPVDAAGLAIEAFGLHDNLMIDRALAAQGHGLITPPGAEDAFWCLERCLEAVSRYQPR